MNDDSVSSSQSGGGIFAMQLDDAFDEGAGEAPPTAFLVGLSGRHAGKLFKIAPGESIVGRTSRAFVTLDEKAVSHQHARLTLTSAGCLIADLQSTNGCFVNDERIVKPRRLQAGDVMRFGNSTLGFLTDAEDESQHTRALARVSPFPMGGEARSVREGNSVSSGENSARSSQSSVQSFSSSGGAPGAQAHTVNSHEIESSRPSSLSALDDILDKLALVRTLSREYWKVLVLSGLVLGVLGAGTIRLKPPKAIAEFEIALKVERTESARMHFATRGVDYFASAEKNFKNVDLVRETMEDMKLSAPLKAVKGTARDLNFVKSGLSSYRGSYRHVDGAFAESFLAQHLHNYLEREIGKSIKVLGSEVKLLQSQFDENDHTLKENEIELRKFREKNLDALPDSARQQVLAKARLIAQRDDLSAQLARSTQQLALAKKQLQSEDAFVAVNVARSQPYETGLAEVKRRIATAIAKGFAQGHPELVQLREEEQALIRLRDSAINTTATETDRRVNLEHKRLSNQVGNLSIAVSTTGQELGQVQARLKLIDKIAGAAPGVEEGESEKLRDVEASKRLHDKLHEQLKAKELELEFERASVAARYEVLEAPSSPGVNLVRTAVVRGTLGAFTGVFLGIFLAAFHWLRTYARQRRESIAHTAPRLLTSSSSAGDLA